MPAYDDGLKRRLQQNLMTFERRSAGFDEGCPSAVAIAIVGDSKGEACFLITRRASRLRSHRNQWALPGGRIDPGETCEDAALRELEEEVGLAVGPEAVLGLLDDYPTRSGYVITPVVVWGPPGVVLAPNLDEVSAVYEVPLADLESPEIPVLKTIPESDRPVISLPIARLRTAIHAPTAAVLYQTREVLLAGRSTRVAHYEQPVFAWK